MKKINAKDLRTQDYRGFDQSKKLDSFRMQPNQQQQQLSQQEQKIQQSSKLINPMKLRNEDYKGFTH